MGADFSYTIIKDEKLKMSDIDIKSKAEGIFENAAYDYGHSGYTGSLAEKLGKGVNIHRTSCFLTEEEAADYVRDKIDSDKWGPADVVVVTDKGWLVGGWCSD